MPFGLLLVVLALVPGADPGTDPGKAAYVRARCDYCHGPTGTGAMGPGLVPYRNSPANLLWVVRRGIGLMPAHAEEFVSDDDVDAIFQFLRRPPEPTAAPLSPELSDAIAQLDRLAFTGPDPAAFERVHAALTRLEGATTGRERRLARYGRALLGWRQLIDAAPEDHVRQEVVATEATSLLREVIATEEAFGEAHALDAAVMALQMVRSPSAQRAAEHRVARERALVLDRDNPRVSLLAGVTALRTPDTIGGGLQQAERHLRRAIQLFERPRSDAWPNWGEAEAHRWLGEVLAAKGDVTGARDAYAAALSLHTEFPLVRDLLVPRLEAADAPRRPRR